MIVPKPWFSMTTIITCGGWPDEVVGVPGVVEAVEPDDGEVEEGAEEEGIDEGGVDAWAWLAPSERPVLEGWPVPGDAAVSAHAATPPAARTRIATDITPSRWSASQRISSPWHGRPGDRGRAVR